jgi:hypothetical protein
VLRTALGPAFAGTQHVTEREAAACCQPSEILQADTPVDDVAHGHIDRRKSGAVESGRHLYLTVDALLAQDRQVRAGAPRNKGCGHVFSGIEGKPYTQPRLGRIENAVVLFLCM